MGHASSARRICFVTGTRAEFGLMRSTLDAIRQSSGLELQLIATGMHLDPTRGSTLTEIAATGYSVDAQVPWPAKLRSPLETASATGRAMAQLAEEYARLRPDIVLVVGDRVEAFAAAAAAQIGGVLLAHVHGGDRALGLVDDSLRHSITKLAHVHFPATAQSAARIEAMGEDDWRIFQVGSPALDDLDHAASWSDIQGEFPHLSPRTFGLLVLHPQTSDPGDEANFAQTVLSAAKDSQISDWVIVYPNTDAGADGIVRCWEAAEADPRLSVRRHLPRYHYLGLLRECVLLLGNSSSGIIEAASFGTPVLDVGSRQQGRERGENVLHVSAAVSLIREAIDAAWNGGSPKRFAPRNIYGFGTAGKQIAERLRAIEPQKFISKLIRY